MQMASLHKQHNRPNWFCAFTDAQGKRLFRSTRTAIKSEAEEICRLWGKTSRDARRKRTPVETLKRAVETTLARIQESRGDTFALVSTESFMKTWLREVEREISRSTFDSYSAITRRFLAYLGAKAREEIGSLTIDFFRGYREQLAKKLSTGTVNNHLTMLRLALDSAMEQELITKNPAKLVKNLARTDKQSRRPFTVAELEKVMAKASPEWRTAILIGLYTGLRLGDATSLKWEDLDLDVRQYTLKTQKTGRYVINPIAGPLFDHLCELRQGSTGDYVCPTFWGRESKVLSNDFNLLLSKAGLIEKRDYRQYRAEGNRRRYAGLSYHCLRHTLTSLLKSAGASSAVAGDIVGHDSEAMSRHYTKIDLAAKREAIDKLPDLGKGEQISET